MLGKLIPRVVKGLSHLNDKFNCKYSFIYFGLDCATGLYIWYYDCHHHLIPEIINLVKKQDYNITNQVESKLRQETRQNNHHQFNRFCGLFPVWSADDLHINENS